MNGITAQNVGEKALKFPAFAYGSEEMIHGIENDSVSIPGLGQLNAPEAFSVFTISLEDPDHPRVIAKTKTGQIAQNQAKQNPAAVCFLRQGKILISRCQRLF